MGVIYSGSHGELDFQRDFIEKLVEVGWKDGILKNATEKDLIENWRKIISRNNIGKLNNVELSENEMGQIISEVNSKCSTPIKANNFLHGRNVPIVRDSNSKDICGRNTTVYLDIFNSEEIAGGKSIYQIVDQVIFDSKDDNYQNRRGDVMLLINGIPVIHIELKASGVEIKEAYNQIQKYSDAGIFTSIFSMIQVFFIITPEDAEYFANPGESSKFNDAFVFRWADKLNIPVTDWVSLCKGSSSILSIPEAHKLVGWYTVADRAKDTLKVLRSYQCNGVDSILRRTKIQDWEEKDPLGGFVWCTTGGGKTLTSFKAGQLIIDQGLADKVVFIIDRVELNDQSLEEYKSFQRDGEDVQETYSTIDLFTKLKSKDSKDSLIVTSIQKLSRIYDDNLGKYANDLDKIKEKRVVFIVDEAHRSNFGKMHQRIKDTFEKALFFGFTGTPIFKENGKDGFTTNTVFGECLAAYKLSDGIRDENVLGFSPTAVETYRVDDLRERVALEKSKSKDEKEALSDPAKWREYQKYYNLEMHGKETDNGYIYGIEDYISNAQYDNDKHRNAVIDDILKNWDRNSYSCNKDAGIVRFHAILATTSIPEAIKYYKLLKDRKCDLNFTALFDPNIDNSGKKALDKSDRLIEIVNDYNKMFDMHFNRKNDPSLRNFKSDIKDRLAHKNQYRSMALDDKEKEKRLDLLIVVDQMLTGFDSQFVNALYLDKVLKDESLIQAMSRTNRVFNKENKPFGIIRFYRKPYTMKEVYLNDALELYCGGKKGGALVASLEENLDFCNEYFDTISKIFNNDGIKDFDCLPKSEEARKKFKKEFRNLWICLNSAKLQGFVWGGQLEDKLHFSKDTYDRLEKRYHDLVSHGHNGVDRRLGYDLDTSLSSMSMQKIDADYLEKLFGNIAPKLYDLDEKEKVYYIGQIEKELGRLSEVEQKYARMIINDIKMGVLKVEFGKKLSDYICEYYKRDRDNKLNELVENLGINKDLLVEILQENPRVSTDLPQNKFDILCKSADKDKVINYVYKKDGERITRFQVSIRVWQMLEDFILNN